MATTNTPVHVAFVLDRSGSMGHVRAATIEGVQLMPATLPGAWLILQLSAAADNPYSVGRLTALFDAVGVTSAGTEKWVANNGWFRDRGGRVLLVVLTDGQENSSKSYTQDGVNTALKRKQDDGWEVMFLGSGGSAWLEKAFHSVSSDRFAAYDHAPAATSANYVAMSAEICNVRRTGKRLANWHEDSGPPVPSD